MATLIAFYGKKGHMMMDGCQNITSFMIKDTLEIGVITWSLSSKCLQVPYHRVRLRDGKTVCKGLESLMLKRIYAISSATLISFNFNEQEQK